MIILTLQTNEPITINPNEIDYINPVLNECTIVLINGERHRVKQSFEDVRKMMREKKE